MSETDPPWPQPSEVAEGAGDAQNDDKMDQRIFDTVTGPNLRLKDNLIQLATIAVGTAIGAGAGAYYARSQGGDPVFGAIVGGFAGVLLSLFLSGIVIGLVRAILAVKR